MIPKHEKQKRLNVFLCSCLPFVFAFLLFCSGCAFHNLSNKSVRNSPAAEPQVLLIQGVAKDGGTIVKIKCSRSVKHDAFKLLEPLRVVMDILAPPASGLSQTVKYHDQNVQSIEITAKKEKRNETRIVFFLSRDLEYKIDTHEGWIYIHLDPLKSVAQEFSGQEAKPENTRLEPSKKNTSPPALPRIFFKPENDRANHILGVDFNELPNSQSRLTVTIDKKVPYHIEQKTKKTLALILENATIPPLLQRRLDTMYFKGAVDQIKASAVPEKRKVELSISLREMVPFHIDEHENSIRLTFEESRKEPPKAELIPLKKSISTPVKKRQKEKGTSWRKSSGMSGDQTYSAHAIDIQFRNESLENVLTFFSQTFGINIVWDPVDIKGKTVSIQLSNIPWDLAFAAIMRASGYIYQIEDSVWYVMSKKRSDKEKKRMIEQAESLNKQKMAESTYEPRLIAYVKVKNGRSAQLIRMIESLTANIEKRFQSEGSEKSNFGKSAWSSTFYKYSTIRSAVLQNDPISNQIIVWGTKKVIKKIRELVSALDVPQKQVMIQARIVEASTSFRRELGIKWGSSSYKTQHNPWGSTGDGTYTYNFSTNLSIPSETTAGISFVNTAATKLLNAQIGFAENEGEVKTLAAPKIMTKNATEALITQGTQIFEPSGADNNGNKTYKAVDAALKLTVTPTVTGNNMVTMDIQVEDSFPDYANKTGDNVPIKKKMAQTTARIASGDTIVIGGIYKEDSSKSEEGTPWLRNVPILGWLFKDRLTTRDRTELLIFLTPFVVPFEKPNVSYD